ncbi:MAG: MFS transporter [Proteobacteria bacterium]|nr:MAG: MFS transporter [Pseudomonadota bacterium]
MLTIPTRRILIFGFLAFVLIGLEQGILGLFVAELGVQLRRSPEDLGLFFALHGVGSAIVTGSALIGWLEKRNNKRIAMASLALGAGGFLVVYGELWILKLIAAPLLGIGFGGLSMSFNTLFVTHFSQKNAGLLNVLNATYGLGAVAAPWLVSTGMYSGTEVFLAIAVLSLVVMIGAWGIDDRVPSNLPTVASEDGNTSTVAPLLGTAFLILFLEAGLTYWMPSLLAKTSDNELIGASYMAAFFGWFVVVRLAAAALATWITTLGFALIGLGGVLASLLFVSTGFIPLSETSFIGAFMGLIFPNAYAWMLMTGHGGTALGAKLLLSAITGATLGPWLLGWIWPIFGDVAVLLTLASASALSMAIMLRTYLRTRKMLVID